MDSDRRAPHRERKAPKPLNKTRLEEMALAYVAKFATSATKLERYLQRKLRERGWEGEAQPDLRALVERYQGLGYVDDVVYARSKSGSLLRRGYGARRVSQALGEAGIAEEIRDETRASPAEERRAALTLARRRGFGPFGKSLPDREKREKQVAAMLRAGHPLDSARKMVDAPDPTVAEEWAAELDDES